MSEWWQGFTVGGLTIFVLMLLYLALAVAAMTAYGIWFKGK